jgi:outer membrane protein assembly factor BamD (BamD/ComL family)
LLSGCATFEESRNRQKCEEHFISSPQLVVKGDYRVSIEENQKVLSAADKSIRGDEALFNIGLIYAHYGNPEKDYKKSLVFFEQIIKEYPQSPLIEKAKIWTGVLKDVEKLKMDDPVITREHMLRSQQLLAQGNYKEALKEIRNILADSSKKTYTDMALFYAGLVYAHYGNPDKDYNKSLAYFEQLIKEYPQSHFLEQARTMIGLLNIIEKAKQVDIEIEQKKKELTR